MVNNKLLVLKFSRSQKLCMDFWLHGVAALNPCNGQGSTLYIKYFTYVTYNHLNQKFTKIISIFQKSKARHREAEWLGKGHLGTR